MNFPIPDEVWDLILDFFSKYKWTMLFIMEVFLILYFYFFIFKKRDDFQHLNKNYIEFEKVNSVEF